MPVEASALPLTRHHLHSPRDWSMTHRRSTSKDDGSLSTRSSFLQSIGPREEPEGVPGWTGNDSEHEEMLRKAAQGWNYRDWNRERREAELREKEEHERSIEEWQAQVESQGFHPCVPCGPPPKETSSMRVLPNVHEALRQNDPSMAPGSQPVLKKAPPSLHLQGLVTETQHSSLMVNLQGLVPPQSPRPSTWDGQPQGVFHSSTPTPMTPGNPPRPPIDALPKPMPMETSQATHKHPLPEPAQQGPPNKHVRHKAFPYGQQPPATASMPSPSSVEMPRPGHSKPEGTSSIIHANSRRCAADVFQFASS